MLDVAHRAGVEITATCGKRGRCRSCRCKIVEGTLPPPTVADNVQLGHEEVRERFRLACQTKLVDDTVISPAPPKTESGYQILGGQGETTAMALDSGVLKRQIKVSAAAESEHHQTSDLDRNIQRARRCACLPRRAARARSRPAGEVPQGEGRADRHPVSRAAGRYRKRRHHGQGLWHGLRYRHHVDRRLAAGSGNRRGVGGRRHGQPAGALRRRFDVADRLCAVQSEKSGATAGQGPQCPERVGQSRPPKRPISRRSRSTRSLSSATPACTISCSASM